MSTSYLSAVKAPNVTSETQLHLTKQEVADDEEDEKLLQMLVQTAFELNSNIKPSRTVNADNKQIIGLEESANPHIAPKTTIPLSNNFIYRPTDIESALPSHHLPAWGCTCTSPFTIENNTEPIAQSNTSRFAPLKNLLRRREKSSTSQVVEDVAYMQRSSPKSIVESESIRSHHSLGRNTPSTVHTLDSTMDQPVNFMQPIPTLPLGKGPQYSSFMIVNYDSGRSCSVSRCASPAERPTPMVRETSSVTITGDPNGTSEFTDPTLPFGGQVNDYQLQHEIGRGSFGKVVLARHIRDNNEYAIKIISKQKLKRKGKLVKNQNRAVSPNKTTDFMDVTRRELAVLKKISNHPNICSLVEVLDDESEDNLFLVFELCLFGPVMRLDSTTPPVPFSEHLSRRYFRDVVLGLEFLHQQMIIHRDLKPENLLLTADNHVQIVDFGISQFLMSSTEIDQDQDASWFKNLPGSPMFMPPEVCREEGDVSISPQCDIWSLGITLYNFTHGHCPFENENYLELANLIQFASPIFDSRVSASCKALIEGMLEKNGQDRFSLSVVKSHPWVTCDGVWPMMSTEENCRRYVKPEDWSCPDVCAQATVTQEEVDSAVAPVVSVLGKLWDRIVSRVSRPNSRNKRRLSESSTLDRSSLTTSTRLTAESTISAEEIVKSLQLETLSEEL